MFTCVLCRFEAELDDVVAAVAGGAGNRCVCLRCFHREVGVPPMAKALRQVVERALAEVEAA